MSAEWNGRIMTKRIYNIEMQNTLDSLQEAIISAKRHLLRQQYWGAYKDFSRIKTLADWGKSALSRSTMKAAMDYGHAISLRDNKGKHTGFAIMEEI
jgi:LAS superfamily LD-carboxypeptidase LdcB